MSEQRPDGVMLAAELVLSVVATAGLEVAAAVTGWPWLTWWSAPLIGFGVVFGGFWFIMWLFEVVEDGDWS